VIVLPVKEEREFGLEKNLEGLHPNGLNVLELIPSGHRQPC
jgi:hypothetical protein